MWHPQTTNISVYTSSIIWYSCTRAFHNVMIWVTVVASVSTLGLSALVVAPFHDTGYIKGRDWDRWREMNAMQPDWCPTGPAFSQTKPLLLQVVLSNPQPPTPNQIHFSPSWHVKRVKSLRSQSVYCIANDNGLVRGIDKAHCVLSVTD